MAFRYICLKNNVFAEAVETIRIAYVNVPAEPGVSVIENDNELPLFESTVYCVAREVFKLSCSLMASAITISLVLNAVLFDKFIKAVDGVPLPRPIVAAI